MDVFIQHSHQQSVVSCIPHSHVIKFKIRWVESVSYSKMTCTCSGITTRIPRLPCPEQSSDAIVSTTLDHNSAAVKNNYWCRTRIKILHVARNRVSLPDDAKESAGETLTHPSRVRITWAVRLGNTASRQEKKAIAATQPIQKEDTHWNKTPSLADKAIKRKQGTTRTGTR